MHVLLRRSLRCLLFQLIAQFFYLVAKALDLVAFVLVRPHAHEMTATSESAEQNCHEKNAEKDSEHRENPPETPHRYHPWSRSPHHDSPFFI